MPKEKAVNSKPKSPKKPVRYSEEVTTRICTQIAQGISLNKICKRPDMPSIVAVYDWLDKYPEFLKKYARAKDDSADTLTDQILDISDDDALDPNDKRVRIDARKWVASKLKPKKYGDKLNVAGEGEGGAIKIIISPDDAKL